MDNKNQSDKKQDISGLSGGQAASDINLSNASDLHPANRHGDMDYFVASEHDEILQAWSLVYNSYHGIGIIDENAHELHCSLQSAHRDSVIVCGKIEEQVVCTLTIINDNDDIGLPLGVVYENRLNELRKSGKRLIEISLLADRRKRVTRTLHSLLEMMRYVFHYAYRDQKIIVIGVHPRHANFYISSFGFNTHGEETTHPSVNDNAVVYLELDLHEQMSLENPPKQLVKYLNHPFSDNVFEHRYCFSKDYHKESQIRIYLDEKYGLDNGVAKAA